MRYRRPIRRRELDPVSSAKLRVGAMSDNMAVTRFTWKWRVILEEIANKMPESVGMLSDCAALANRKNLELLEEARIVHDDWRARAKNLLDDLEAVEEFVSEKYYKATAGKDEKEQKVRHQIQKVINSLRQLS